MSIDYYNSKLRVLVGKIESTKGTAETLVDSDFDVRIRDISAPDLSNIGVDDESSMFATGGHGGDISIIGERPVTLSCSIKLANGGASATEPLSWKFLKACGLVSKTYSTNGVALQDSVDGDDATMTLGVYDIQMGSTPTAVLYSIAGSMGDCTIGCEGVGMPVKMDFEFTGKIASVSDVANADIPVLTSPNTTTPAKGLSNTVTINGSSAKINSWSLALGNTVAQIKSVGESTGIFHSVIQARNPVLTLDPYQQSVANEDVFAALVGETTGVVSVSTGEAIPFTLKIPVAQLLPYSIEDRDGLTSHSRQYRALRNAGSDSDIADESTFELLQGARS